MEFQCMLKPKELLLHILYYVYVHTHTLKLLKKANCKLQVPDLRIPSKPQFGLLLHIHYNTIFNYLISYFYMRPCLI